MRNISFFLTQKQIEDQSKTVTRRLGWKFLKPETILQPVVKAQGLKKGEKIQKLGCPIRVKSARREPLHDITWEDCKKEGFPDYSPSEFMDMLCMHYGLNDYTVELTRIEFEYTEVKKQK